MVMVTSSNILEEEEFNWKSVISLLDDDSPIVRDQLIKLFTARPKSGHSFLLQLSQGEDPFLAKHAQYMIERLGWIDGVSDFFRFIKSMRYELETGYFLLDRTIYPELDTSTYTFFLDKLADRCRELILSPATPRMTCEIINRVLFHEYGFRGSRENFDNPANSFLYRVLDRREGIPISLCVVYLLVARRIGFELDPIGTPGRFLLGCFAEKKPFYIDCWSGGRFIELEQMEDKLGIIPDDEAGAMLLPVTVSETLSRACRNLARQYSKQMDISKAQMFASFVEEFERVYREAPNA